MGKNIKTINFVIIIYSINVFTNKSHDVNKWDVVERKQGGTEIL